MIIILSPESSCKSLTSCMMTLVHVVILMLNDLSSACIALLVMCDFDFQISQTSWNKKSIILIQQKHNNSKRLNVNLIWFTEVLTTRFTLNFSLSSHLGQKIQQKYQSWPNSSDPIWRKFDTVKLLYEQLNQYMSFKMLPYSSFDIYLLAQNSYLNI